MPSLHYFQFVISLLRSIDREEKKLYRFIIYSTMWLATVNDYFWFIMVIVLSLFSSAIGPVPSPFDWYLANRGLKTLHLRMRQHQVNATTVARFLEKNPRAERVIYPSKTTGVCMPYYDTGFMLVRDWQRWGILLPMGVFWFDTLPTNPFGKFQFSFMPHCSKTFGL